MMTLKSWRAMVACACLVAAPAGAVDLIEVYNEALAADPTLKEAAANRLATLESKPQALAALLPQIDGQYVYNQSWTSGSATFQSVVVDPNTGDQNIANVTTGLSGEVDERRFWQLQLTQTLFRWDQWITLKQADKQVAQAEARYLAAQQDLMTRVSQRYFDTLSAEATLEAAEAAKDSIGRQLEQAEKRFEVGLIAITDVQEAKASYDLSVADVIEAKRQVAVARESLREITGRYYETLAAAGPELPLQPPDPTDADAWVQTALQQNLSLEASRLGAQIAREQIGIQRAGHMPTVDLFARRSNDFSKGTRQNKPEQLDPADFAPPGADNQDIWNDVVGVQVNVPIFSGGAVSSRVDQAVYEHRAATEQLERVARETERQVRDAYLSVTAEISRVQALAQAVESNATALRATEAGFEVGTRTTVDVLDARRTLFEAQRDYARSRYTYLTNALNLKQAAGILGPEDLRQVNGWLAE